MPFNIPNAADAEDAGQAQVDSRDFGDILVAAFAGTGVVNGCAVTAQGTPNMTVAVAAGTVAVAGATAAVTGGNVTITTAHATLSRFDLICVDNAGVKSAVAGTAASNPTFPNPSGKVVLAAVRVAPGATAINTPKIVDKRVAPVVVPQAVPPGMYAPYAGSVAPAGWILCDGSAVSRTTYAALFSLLGTSHGAGDGSTTFNVPDFRGRVPVGLGTNTDVNTLAANEGAALASRSPKHNSTPSLGFLGTNANTGNESADHVHNVAGNTGGQSADHTHTIPAQPVGPASGGPSNWAGASPGYNTGPTSNDHSHGFNVNSAGRSAAHTHNYTPAGTVTGSIGPGGSRPTDTPAYLVVNYIIKT